MQFRDHPGVQGKRDAYPFDPRLLKIEEGYNPRNLDAADERDDLEELKESIRSNGVRVPLEVRLIDEDVYVVSGHRRHRAVMELISEGEEIKAIPVMPEPKHTSEVDRILNLVVSNSGKPLKPLEVAEVVRRLVAFGWEKQQIAKRLGWKSAASVTQHLELIALPEPVKDQVRDGAISSTEAAKVVKGLPKGTDPKLAADLIAANQEENKRLGVGKRNGNKVTAKTLNRDKPKAPEPKKESAPSEPYVAVDLSESLKVETIAVAGTSFTPLSDETPPAPVHPQLQEVAARETPVREFPPEAFQPPTKAHDFDRQMFEIVTHIAMLLEGFDLNAFEDHEGIGISINAKTAKLADRTYRSRIGDL